MAALLDIHNLSVSFGALPQSPRAVAGLDLTLNAGEVVGIVGESGSGKSVSMLALMDLVDAPGQVSADHIVFNGQDLLHMKPAEKRRLIGRDMAMVFQDALTSLNPAYTVGYQLVEALRQHTPLRGDALKREALGLLEQVEIPDAKARFSAYPHQLSGGMNQRVMIAMAIACKPKLLIADEPTTALDVTVQAQIMALLRNLNKTHGMALILISHDLAVVAEAVERVVVMYAGEAVEYNQVPQIFDAPRHPYTQALLASIPQITPQVAATQSKQAERKPLYALPGLVPGQYDRPSGCLLAPRCPYVQPICAQSPPLKSIDNTAINNGQKTRCFFPLDHAGKPSHAA